MLLRELFEAIDPTDFRKMVNDFAEKYRHQVFEARTKTEFTTIIRKITNRLIRNAKLMLGVPSNISIFVTVKFTAGSGIGGESSFAPGKDGIFAIHIGEDSWTRDRKEMEGLWAKLKRTLVHEMMHLYQWNKSQGAIGRRKKGIMGPIDNDSDTDDLGYYSDKHEINVFVVDAIDELEEKGINLKKLYEKYISGEKTTNLFGYLSSESITFMKYYRRFGSKKDNGLAQKTWNRFLKNFVWQLKRRIDNISR